MGTRERLMKAAAELIVEVGFEAMTTAAVAKRAGVSEGAIYRHFEGKLALAEAVFSDIWLIFNEFLEKNLPPRAEPVARIEAFFPTTLMALDALMPRYGALAQQDQLHFAAKRGCRVRCLPEGPQRYVDLLEETIRLAQDAGRVRPAVDSRIAAHFLFFGAGQAMDFFGDAHHRDREVERLPRAVFLQLEDLMSHALYGGPR